MTNSPKTDPKPKNRPHRRRWLLLVSRTGIFLGVPLLILVAGGAWWLWKFVHEELAPLVEKNLTETLNRQVQLGQVEQFSLTSLRFGASSIPATSTDPDRLRVDAVDVAFDPLQLLFNRTLTLDITLTNPDVYIEQDRTLRWVSTNLKAQSGEGLIKTDIDTITFRNGDLVLLPYKESQGKPVGSRLGFAQVDGVARLRDNSQLIEFDLDAQPTRGGVVALAGDFRPKTQQANLQIQTQNLLASDVTRLVKLPLDLQAGRVDGNLTVQIPQKEEPPNLLGAVQLKAVTAQVNQLPQAFINTQGTVRFKGKRIQLENVVGRYGKIPAVANGVINTVAGYNLSARVKAVSVADAQQTLKIKLPVTASGVVRADVKLTGGIESPILSGTVATTKPARIDRVNFSEISTGFTLSTDESVISFRDIEARPTVGGLITGSGFIQLGQNQGLGFNAVARNVPGDAIAQLYNVSPNIKIGTVSARTQIAGSVQNPRTIVNWQASQATYPAQGQIIIANANTLFFRDTVVNVGGGTIRGNGQLINQRWQAQLQANNVQLGRLAQVPPALQSPLSGTFNVSGTTKSFAPESITATGTARLQVGNGTVIARNIQLDDGRWQAQLQANNVQLGRLAQVPPALQSPLSGTFNVSGTTKSFAPEAIAATGTGRLQIANGIVIARNIQLRNGRWQTELQANNVPLARLAQVPPQFRGLLTGTFNLSGTTSFKPETFSGTGVGRLNVAGGTYIASNIRLQQGRWQSNINASQVQLNQFDPQLRGQLSGQVNLAGTIDSFNLADIRGSGEVRFSQGISLVEEPLTAAINWDGEKITVQRATAPGFLASGQVFVVQGVGAPEITRLNLDVQAENYNLQALRFDNLPTPLNLAGRADFNGRITGRLPTPNVVGALEVRNLVVNNLAFEPSLDGNIALAPGGLQLEVIGTSDRIALNLDANNRPRSFLIVRGSAVASGRTQGENLLVNVENFPLNALNFSFPPNPVSGTGAISGLISGDLTINRQTFAVVGDIAIASPAIGRIKGDELLAQFRYANGTATITSSEFIQGDSSYALTGSITPTANGPKFQAQINIDQGKIQNVLTALQIFDLQDFQRGLQPANYGNSSVLNTVPVGLPEASLLTQLRRFSEIEALVAQQRQQRQDAFPLPPLEELKGTFSGEIAVNGSLQTGIAVNFDLAGNNWEWGSYTANQLIAQGSFENGVLTLLPLRIESDERLLAFNGQIGGTQQSGQLRVVNFPIEVLNEFVNLPVPVTGNLNATATLAGSTANPQAIGELQLNNATLNQKNVQSATASFSYNNARLDFGSTVVVAATEPIQISGSIPLKLPFASVTPQSNQISLDVNVQNEGLALLNLFTDQVAWQEGEGQIQLQVRGTIDQPIATGTATVNNATITAQALPEPLTDVTGNVQFDFDRVFVQFLQGNFSQGSVVAEGVIPIFGSLQPDDPDFANPLRFNLDQLVLNLKGLYQGGASGNVVITGALLNPIIGGEVVLADGQVLVGESARTTQTSNSTPTSNSGAVTGSVPEFNNLRLSLGDDIAITQPPILNFAATGSLNLNGTIDDLRPDGTIRLRRGSVNLFTTQFVLARGYEHMATFSPNQGLDPTLDIRLVAAVPEVTQRRVPSSQLPSEITEGFSTNVGALRTVRVQARVTGAASQLFDNLELTSDPPRSESEIIALIGGGFVDTLGRGDSTLALANLAGSALFGTFQGTITNIGNTFGLSELRLFPTVLSSDVSRNSTLGLAAEAGIDISRNVSVSILRVLTANQPTQFGLTYRVNNDVRVRTSTDFSSESLAIIEYEKRF